MKWMMLRSQNAMLAILLLTCAERGIAGPPFKTDDPQPVDFRHWEFYLASVQQFERSESDATLPHLEINYGILPDIQLHLVAPMGYVRSTEGTRYGYSSTEVGVKFRFLPESESILQIGIFPMVELPTGDKRLGETDLQLYLPIWLQKSWGHLTTYGGGGYWVTPKSPDKNWGYLGWQVQYDFSEVVTLGSELYYTTADKSGQPSDAGFGLGGFVNIDENNHILYSLGHNLLRTGSTSGYLGYQLTF